MYEEMIQYVKRFFEDNDINATELAIRYPFRNRFEHSMRVYQWVQRINAEEGGDTEVVSVAAIFHDVGKAVKSSLPHARISADICDRYLEEIDFPSNKRKQITHTIRVHSMKADRKIPLTREDKILMDADMLDEVGALAVLWDSMAVALEKGPSYKKAYERHLEYYRELEKDQAFLKTECGKRLYKERLSFLGEFIENLKYELGS